MRSGMLSPGATTASRICFLLSSLLLCLAGVLLVPLAVAVVYGEGRIAEAFLSTILLCTVAGLSGALAFRGSLGTLSRREGFAVVGLGWMLVCLVGSLPFVFSHTLGFVDALFECVSGMTGTGASVIPDIESVSRGIVFWRSFTHWLGGMGFVVLYIAVFPLLGVGAMQLYQAEAPGPEKDKVTPRIRDTARVMWLIYIGLSVVLTVLLLAGGMNLFDALCHTFGAIGTGGSPPVTQALVPTRAPTSSGSSSSSCFWRPPTSPCTTSCSEESRCACSGTPNGASSLASWWASA